MGSDTVLLGYTRYSNAYGVPLAAFLPALVAASLAFAASRGVPIVPRAVLCVGAFGGVMFGMWRLAEWETRWWHVLLAWVEVRLPALFAAATRRFGGTTYQPASLAPGADRVSLRDHAGVGKRGAAPAVRHPRAAKRGEDA